MPKIPVLKAARHGHSVYSNDRFLNIDSTKNTLKEFNTYTGTLTANSSNLYLAEDTITHNLGYQPLIMAWRGSASEFGVWNQFQGRYVTDATIVSDPTDVAYYIEYIDDNSFKMVFTTAGFNGVPFESTIDYVCRVFIDPAREAWYE